MGFLSAGGTKYGALPSAPRTMPSAFEKVVKNVIKEVSGSRGDLIPVDSLRNSTSFRPYCLLNRKFSSSRFWKPRYSCVNLSIKDILEPSAPEPGIFFPILIPQD
jgi:hypothetical protein